VKTVAIVGASGFVGATLTERLLESSGFAVRPLIHSSGGAWRLSRHGGALRGFDLLSLEETRSALAGCTHVVNCSRGTRALMFQGLANLLAASLDLGVERFVHLSSVAVYGDPPPPESVHEEAEARPARSTYGWDKLQQDVLVQDACRRGLPSVLICPPYMTGRYSNFLLRLVGTIAEGSFALVDGGAAPCNVVDVHNVAQAMELALTSDAADGSRVFVTHEEPIDWRALGEAVAPLAGVAGPLPTVAARDVQAWAREARPPRRSPLASAKRLLRSPQVQDILREDPLFKSAYAAAMKAAGALPASARERLKRVVKPPVRIAPPPISPRWDRSLSTIQLRHVRHACEKARKVLGYRPERSFAHSMETFAAWYRGTRGWGEDFTPLLRALEQTAPQRGA
jgi:nucleoside-diphosphate-sugar epimerase